MQASGSNYIFGHCSLTSFYQVNNTVTEHVIQRWPIHCISTQCRLNTWARWTVARGPHEHRGHANLCMLCIACIFKVYTLIVFEVPIQ